MFGNCTQNGMKNIFWLSLLVNIHLAFADLPIHCTLPQVIGEWELALGSSPVTDPDVCKSSVERQTGEVYTITLMGRSSQQLSHRIDLAYSGAVTGAASSSAATWNLVYDEGLVIKTAMSRRMTFYGRFDYALDPNFKGTPEKFVTIDGRTPGYVSRCDSIKIGWMLSADHSEVRCFSAKRTKVGTARGPLVISRSLLTTEKDFRAPFTDPPSGLGNQGNCGSCFVWAFAYAFERILRSHYARLNPGSPTVASQFQLDREAILSCSYSGTGCDGGYFSNLTLDVSYLGAPEHGCMDSVASDLSSVTGRAKSCSRTCYQDPSKLNFPDTFHELSSEADIMHYLKTNGPVPVGIYLPELINLSNIKRDRIYELERVTPDRGYWDYLNHGVVITGWGENVQREKYWTVYNPWGVKMMIARGGANRWIARHAIAIIPDLCRGHIYTLLAAAGKAPVYCSAGAIRVHGDN